MTVARSSDHPKVFPKPAPIYEVDELRTAHDVRKIRQCCHCEGAGVREAMVYIGQSVKCGEPRAFYHPQCYLGVYGFRTVTELPLSERDKYRLCDLNTRQLRRLMALRSTRP